MAICPSWPPRHGAIFGRQALLANSNVTFATHESEGDYTPDSSHGVQLRAKLSENPICPVYHNKKDCIGFFKFFMRSALIDDNSVQIYSITKEKNMSQIHQ